MVFATTLYAVEGSSPQDVAKAIREGQFTRAREVLRPLLASQPANPQLLALDGMALAGLKRYTESLAAYNKALAIRPDYVPALAGKAEIEYRVGAKTARATLDRFVALRPDDQTAHAMLGSLAFSEGNCRQALKHFERGRGAVLRSAAGAAQFGDCLVRTGRTGEALRLLHGRNEPETVRVVIAAYIAERKTAEAIEALRGAIALHPREESFYLELGALCADHKAYDLGLEVLGVGARNIPTSASVRVLRGMLFAEKGDYGSAEREFDAAGRLRPEKGFDVIGVTFTSTLAGDKELERAIGLLRQRLKTAPNDGVLNYLLGEALLRRQVHPGQPEFDEAHQALLRSVKAQPDLAKAHVSLGRIYQKLERPQEAVRELEIALKLDSSDQLAVYLYGRALQLTGREREAREAFGRLRRLKAEERQAEAEKQRMRLVRAAP